MYLAQHTLIDSRLVAIKILHPDVLASEKKRMQFVQEARVLEQLRHPHILSVVDAGIHEGFPYLITPYAKGGTLSARITRAVGRLFPLDEVLRIVS